MTASLAEKLALVGDHLCLAAGPGPGWGPALPQISERGALLQLEQRRVLAVLEAFPQQVLDRTAEALAAQWRLPAEPVEGLELRVTAPGSTQTCRLVFGQRVIGIGTDQEAQLFLPELGVRGWRWQILRGLVGTRLVVHSRGENRGCEVGDHAIGSATTLNGEPVDSGGPYPLATGDCVEIAGYRIELGEPQVLKAPEEVSLEAVGAHVFLDGSPFGRLGSDTSLWLRLTVEEWSGFVRIPATWLDYSYRSLGHEKSEREGSPLASEVDRAVTSYLFERAALSLAEECFADGVGGGRFPRPSLSALLTRRQVEELALGSGRHDTCWRGAEMRLVLAGAIERFEVVWPAESELRPAALAIGATKRGSLPQWLAESQQEVRVVAGAVTLDACAASGLRRRDVLLPEEWLKADDGDLMGPLAAGCEIELRLQHLSRRARILPKAAPDTSSTEEGSGLDLELLDDQWLLSRRGEVMSIENQNVAEAPHTVSVGERAQEAQEPVVRLPEQLEVEITFELARRSVSLGELLEWRQGQVLGLERAAEDPLRIVLQQPGSKERWLGTGRVVLIEERLGVQIEEWWVCDDEE